MRPRFPAPTLVSTLWLAAACASSPPSQPRAAARPAPPDAEWFADVTGETGPPFEHFNGMSGEFYLVEIMGPGVALFDYDNDGDLDLYVTQGHMLGRGKTPSEATIPPREPLPLRDRLFRNDLEAAPGGSRRFRFVDVTEAAGLDVRGYGMGVATGDYDNDGWTDLYVTNYGPNVLLHNNGDGTFTDVTEASGTGAPEWSVPAAFFDYDRDGWLDLFVGNYVDFSVERNKDCYSHTGVRDYCAPDAYAPLPDRLYRNRGDGTFEDVTLASGLARAPGPALGVVTADLDGDGWLDVYVANDRTPNHFWRNRGDGTFEEVGMLAGCAVNAEGKAEASMGVDADDFDADGDLDLFMTHLRGETNTLYANDGKGFFEDRSTFSGLADPSRPRTGFGTAWFDYDNDGWLDLFAANGAVQILEDQRLAGEPLPLREPNQLFRNTGGRTFEDVSARAGACFAVSEVSRAAAFGDLDNDGDADIVVANNAGPLRVLRNEIGQRRSWIGLRLVEGSPPRDAFGTRVALKLRSGRTLWRWVRTAASYAAASDPRILFGLGEADDAVEAVVAYWPDGGVETWPALEPGRYHLLRRGSGSGAR